MSVTAYTIAGGYYKPGSTPQIVEAVRSLIAVGWVPYGSPQLGDVAGWVAQPMIKTDQASATDYTVITGYDGSDRRTPVIGVPVAGWSLLGDVQWLSSHYYLQAWMVGTQFNDILPIDLATDVTGVLPIANGGTSASTAPQAWTNLGGGTIGKLNTVTLTTDVTGVLPIDNGGTGNTSGNAVSATKLQTARTIQTNLASTTAAAFDGTANIQPGVTGALPIANGGTAATNTDDAAKNLKSATKAFNINPANTTDLNNVLGLGGEEASVSYQMAATNSHTIANWPNTARGTAKAYGWGAFYFDNVTPAGGGAQYVIQRYQSDTGEFYCRSRYGSSANWKAWAAFWTSFNTTVDANGFIKAASPIVSLYGDGTVTVNEEAAGVTGTRLGVGQYKLDGTLGLNSDPLWWMEVPKDVNGQPLIWLDYTVNSDGSILINTYHRVHPDSPVYARNVIEGVQNGDAIDIPSGKYVTIRVNMPV